MFLCPNESVGAVVKDEQGRFLCLYRQSKTENDPTRGLAFLAGHRDWLDQSAGVLDPPVVALGKEVYEEANLIVTDCRLLLVKEFPNPCKRGFNSHKWWLYEVIHRDGQLINKELDKHLWLKFLSTDEILSYVQRGDYDPAWGEYLWPALGII